MTRSCSVLFLIALASAYCDVASAQSAAQPPAAAPPVATPNAPPATAAPAASDANAAAADGASTPTPESAATPSAASAPDTPTAAPPAASKPEPEPERRPSFLDAHASGYLPEPYRADTRVHRGVSVRVSAGLGYGIMRRNVTESSSYRVRGLEGQLSLDIGASVIDNLIVFGRFSGFAWNSVVDSDSKNAGGAYIGLLGAGARYYLMPANAFASAAIGIAALQVLNDRGVSQNANPGFGMELEVGKDFWAGTPLDQRGIGLSMRFGWVHCGSVPPGEQEQKPWNSYSISVLFSAAYN